MMRYTIFCFTKDNICLCPRIVLLLVKTIPFVCLDKSTACLAEFSCKRLDKTDFV